MDDVNRFIEDRGGLAATYELHRLGYGRADITEALRADVIVRVRQGWYCNPWLEPAAQQAARVGGQLTCSSGARFWGLWVPGRETELHVGLDPHTSRLRTRNSSRTRLRHSDASVRLHWTGTDTSRSRLVAAPATCLAQIPLCHPPEFTVVAVESALNRGLISKEEWQTNLSGLPLRLTRALPDVGALSDSGIETMFATRMRARGIEVRQQFFVDGAGFVDALIGDALIIELDGAAFHRDDARDRRRDAISSIRGFRVLRFLAAQVTNEWDLVEAAVVAAVARGDHLRARAMSKSN